MSRARLVLAAAALPLLLAGCATTRPLVPGSGERVGVASYYGERFHGRRTASGEVFDMHRLTAAHRTLPFGTRVRVTNLANGEQVVVKINDRGPAKEARIIDVSYAAARRLGFVRSGVTRVKIEPE